jgi:DcmR-like sensory protein
VPVFKTPADRFNHLVAFYDDHDGFLATALPFLRDGLEADEATMVAVGPEKAELMRGELGAEAEGVRFEDIEELGRNPARIIPAWREFADSQQPGAAAG